MVWLENGHDRIRIWIGDWLVTRIHGFHNRKVTLVYQYSWKEAIQEDEKSNQKKSLGEIISMFVFSNCKFQRNWSFRVEINSYIVCVWLIVRNYIQVKLITSKQGIVTWYWCWIFSRRLFLFYYYYFFTRIFFLLAILCHPDKHWRPSAWKCHSNFEECWMQRIMERAVLFLGVSLTSLILLKFVDAEIWLVKELRPDVHANISICINGNGSSLPFLCSSKFLWLRILHTELTCTHKKHLGECWMFFRHELSNAQVIIGSFWEKLMPQLAWFNFDFFWTKKLFKEISEKGLKKT